MTGNFATKSIPVFMQPKSIPRGEMEVYCKTKFKEFGMSDTSIHSHVLACRHLATFMEREGYSVYTPDVGSLYCEFITKESQSECRTYAPPHYRYALRIVRRLNESFDNVYNSHPEHKARKIHFAGDFGEAAKQYLIESQKVRISAKTIRKREICLGALSMYFHQRGITMKNISRQDIFRYIDYRRKTCFSGLDIDRVFFTYLSVEGMIKDDYSTYFSHIKQPTPIKPIRYYLDSEIETIEKSINRLTTKGKQDYAITLLASRLGLRASDIAELSFDNINWDDCLITKVQYKTHNTIVLPLLEDVGNALIDYIRFSRPQIKSDRIFITSSQPHRPFISSRVSCIVRDVILKSGVPINGRPTGPHALRHSLATNLVSIGTGLPIVSGILGHSSTESTKEYLGVSMPTLLECSLDVPLVNDDFFKQKGGCFYG